MSTATTPKPTPNTPPPARGAVSLIPPACKARDKLAQRERGLICTALGRGRTGKTLLMRFLIERALRQGRLAIAADGDRFNQSLASYTGLGQPMRPTSAEDVALRAWLERAFTYAAENRAAIGLDLGGGDRSLLARADDLVGRIKPVTTDLGGWGLEQLADLTAGVDLCVLYHMAGGADDARGLALITRTRLIEAPLLLILNEGVAPETRDGDLFATNRADPAVKTALDRGAHLVRLPALPAHIVAFIEGHRLGFAEAAAGSPGPGGTLSLWDRQALVMWIREVEAALSKHQEVLP